MTPEFAAWFDAFAHEAVAQGVAPMTLQKVIPILELDVPVGKQGDARGLDQYI